MKATQLLHDLGQSIWIDNITRDMLDSGTLKRYIDEYSVTGLTSNPTIFNLAVKNSASYDASISQLGRNESGENLFFHIAIQDLTRAADLFKPIYDRTNHVDGYVSLEVSPLLAYDTQATIKAAKELCERAGRPNLFIKIPGTKEGLPAIEECIYSGIPINITLLFDREQYLAAADAYMRGIERRIKAGLNPNVASVASVFVSRWDASISKTAPEPLRNKLGIAIAGRIYQAYRELLVSPRWMRALNEGAIPQRLLWASTGTKDPKASNVLYVNALGAPFTVNTMPDVTLNALAGNDSIGSPMKVDASEAEKQLKEYAAANIDVTKLAAQLQEEGAKAFVTSWNELMGVMKQKSAVLETVR